jgi:hypothetical protein
VRCSSSILAFPLVALAGLAACGGADLPTVTPPTAPALAVDVDLKALQFTWSASTGAERYRMLEDATGSSSLTALDENLGAATTSYTRSIGVHRVAWARARYALEACNTAGCTRSNVLGIAGQAQNAIGYLKASDTARRAYFGSATAVSGDGNTAAVGAIGWDGAEGAVYVFVRENGTWKPQSRVRGNFTEAGDRFGLALALSDDGSTLIVGAPEEDSGARVINGNERGSALSDSGAAYVFVRSGGAWNQQAYLKVPNPDVGDELGTSVAVSADGNTVVVGAPCEDSRATRVDGNAENNNASDAGAAYVFVRSGTSWSLQSYIKASNTDSEDWFGYSVALSDNGNTLAVGAPWEDSAATGVGGNQANNAVAKAGAVYVFTRSGTTWSAPIYVKASTTDSKDWFGWSVALSGDGATLAVAAPHEGGGSGGIGGDQANNGRPQSGAVYVFAQSGATWQQTAYIKAGNPETEDEFGWALALSDNGDTLAIGAPGEDSNALAIDGNGLDNTAAQAGAAYAFKRTAGTWSQQAYVKATNTNAGDRVGYAVALSGNGDTLLVGAPSEASSATGIGGDQGDNTRAAAGAAYLY